MATLLPLIVFLGTVHHASAAGSQCKTIPEDSTWPQQAAWDAFNASVDGRLIHSTPLAYVCHQGSPFGPFDQAKCDVVRNSWNLPEFHEPSSSSIMSAPFSNRSCDPFETDLPCNIGHYVEYSVDVSTVDHVVKTVKFAKQSNIRFVVRNTGHDYMGKSTGHGGLAVWMHHLTQTQWITAFSSPSYRGPAVKAYAGVSVMQMYQEASARGYSITGGSCPTVGFAGGYFGGGGHGPLSSKYGLLADNVVSLEVITTNGDFLTASPTNNSDLFWAMRGGGPGTYGILWSITVKVHPDMPFGGGTLAFQVGGSVTPDIFWKGIAAYHNITNQVIAAQGYSLSIYTSSIFALAPLILPNATADDVHRIMDPLLSELQTLGIPYQSTIASYPGFLQAVSNRTLFPDTLSQAQNGQVGGRLIPKSIFASSSQLQQLNDLARSIVESDPLAGANEIILAPSQPANNSVLPAWRNAQASLAVFLLWNNTGTGAQVHQQQQKITNDWLPRLKQLTPGSGAYLNEGDAFDPEFQQSFYGANYNALLAIKDKYDPSQLLYGGTAVGGDRWAEDADGRLCKVQ